VDMGPTLNLRCQAGHDPVEVNTVAFRALHPLMANTHQIVGDIDIKVALASHLQGHDWYYSYSDDITVWRKGEKQLGEIKGLIGAMSDKDAARELWEKHAPKGFAFPG
jgi:hypothetical protein